MSNRSWTVGTLHINWIYIVNSGRNNHNVYIKLTNCMYYHAILGKKGRLNKTCLSHIPWPAINPSTIFLRISMPRFQSTISSAMRINSPIAESVNQIFSTSIFSKLFQSQKLHTSYQSNCFATLYTYQDNVHVIVHHILIPSSYYAINTHPIRSS